MTLGVGDDPTGYSLHFDGGRRIRRLRNTANNGVLGTTSKGPPSSWTRPIRRSGNHGLTEGLPTIWLYRVDFVLTILLTH